jgi:NAD(P)-dependent dehydrogenase (short-subunit alcohol dehydrogenase family)
MRSVLITGTSSGIGLEAASLLAERGWRVLASMRDLAKREALQRALAKNGAAAQVSFVQLDLTDPDSIERGAGEVLAACGGKLDALVHNAGISAAGAVEDIPMEDIRRVLETNFLGPVALTRRLLPAFRAQGAGRIVLVSSEAAFFGQPANSIYCASKWALEGWGESIAFELAAFGIDVVIVEPGPYRTEIWRSSLRFAPEGSPYRDFARTVFRSADAHAAQMARDPKEVAETIANALAAKRPRFRYTVGPFARLGHLLRGKIPSRLMRRGMSRYLGLKG